MVRFEPAGTRMGPAATPLTVGMVNTNGVGMSVAVTSTTTIATEVPVSSALMNSFVWTALPSTPAGSRDRHALHAISSSVAVMSRRIRAPPLWADGEGGHTRDSLDDSRDRSGARSGGRYQSRAIDRGDARVMRGPRDDPGGRIPLGILDGRRELHC